MQEIYHTYQWNRFEPDFETLWLRYWQHNENLWSLYRKNEIDKYTLTLRRLREPLPWLMEKSDNEILALNKAFLAATATKTGLVSGALATLEYLHRYYRIYILSNGFREVQSKKLERSGLAPYVHRMILSEDAGINKPHKEIFTYAFSCTNSRASESLMIGDSWEADIEGARRAGMSAIWFNPQQLPLPHQEYKPLYIIQELSQLCSLL